MSNSAIDELISYIKSRDEAISDINRQLKEVGNVRSEIKEVAESVIADVHTDRTDFFPTVRESLSSIKESANQGDITKLDEIEDILNNSEEDGRGNSNIFRMLLKDNSNSSSKLLSALREHYASMSKIWLDDDRSIVDRLSAIRSLERHTSRPANNNTSKMNNVIVMIDELLDELAKASQELDEVRARLTRYTKIRDIKPDDIRKLRSAIIEKVEYDQENLIPKAQEVNDKLRRTVANLKLDEEGINVIDEAIDSINSDAQYDVEDIQAIRTTKNSKKDLNTMIEQYDSISKSRNTNYQAIIERLDEYKTLINKSQSRKSASGGGRIDQLEEQVNALIERVDNLEGKVKSLRKRNR